MSNLSFSQSLYISLAIVGGLIVLLLVLFLLYRNFYRRKHLPELVGRMLFRFSNLNDYLLLNDYHIHIDDKHVGVIDHVLITNKFIIIINDFMYSGVITGDYNDEQLKIVDKSGERLIINPLNYNINLTKRIGIFNSLDNSFLRGIVVVNDDSFIDVSRLPDQFVICRKKDLKNVIKEFDSVDVKPFKEDTVVNFINYLNEHNLKETSKK